MAESSLEGLKTLWEKEKLLVTSNFSFSHSVFKRLVLQTRKNQGLFGKGLNSILFSDESKFTIHRGDGRVPVYCRRNECYANCCVLE